MRNLGDFFGKFSRFKRPNEDIRRRTQEITKEILGFDVAFESISFRGGVVHVRVTGAYKTELILNKNKIIERLRAEFPAYTIIDIR